MSPEAAKSNCTCPDKSSLMLACTNWPWRPSFIYDKFNKVWNNFNKHKIDDSKHKNT